MEKSNSSLPQNKPDGNLNVSLDGVDPKWLFSLYFQQPALCWKFLLHRYFFFNGNHVKLRKQKPKNGKVTDGRKVQMSSGILALQMAVRLGG
jgi:hypothetical protein